MQRLICGAILAVFLGGHAQAQVRQSGNVTPGHVSMWTTNGIIQDGGTAAIGNLTELGVTRAGPGICQNSGPVTGPFNQLCLGVGSNTGGFLSMTGYGGGSGGFEFVINGTAYSFPFNGPGSGVIGPVSSTLNDVACWNSTIGGALSDCGSTTALIPSKFKLGITPSPAVWSSFGAGANLMSQEVFRVEIQNTHTAGQADINFGGGFLDDAGSFWRVEYQPAGGTDAGGVNRNGLLLVNALPATFTVSSTLTGIQSVAEVQGTAIGDQLAFFGVAEVDLTGASAVNLYAFDSTCDLFAGTAISGECGLYVGHLSNTSGNPIATQAGIDIGASGSNITNRYGIILRDFTGSVSGDNYGIKQLGTTGTRKNLFNANTTIGSADTPSQNGSLAKLGTVQSGAFTEWDFVMASYSSTTGYGGGFLTSYSRSNTPGSFAIVSSGDVLQSLYALGDDGTFLEQAAAQFVTVDGTPGANSMPGRITWATTKSGAISVTEHMRLDNKGHLSFSNATPTNNSCTGFALGTDSTDMAGTVAFTSATSCAINFSVAYTNAPNCVVAPGSAASTVEVVATTTVLTATFGSAQTKMSWACFGT